MGSWWFPFDTILTDAPGILAVALVALQVHLDVAFDLQGVDHTIGAVMLVQKEHQADMVNTCCLHHKMIVLVQSASGAVQNLLLCWAI